LASITNQTMTPHPCTLAKQMKAPIMVKPLAFSYCRV
jgi:hypothetical protein